MKDIKHKKGKKKKQRNNKKPYWREDYISQCKNIIKCSVLSFYI